jgi:hypothetical protein
MIIGISGKARSGKDQFGEYLIECLRERHKRFFRPVAFAAQLKTMCKLHFGLSNDQLWGDKKEEPDERFHRPVEDWKNSKGAVSMYWTPREIMQELGGFYRRIDNKFWVKSLDQYLESMNVRDAIITDVRHINECEYVKKNQGVLIKVTRESADKIHGMHHESETALDDRPEGYFDLTIVNDWGLKELQVAAEEASDMIINLENLIKKGRIV